MTVRKKSNLEVSDWELLQSLQECLASNLTAKDLGKKLSDLLKIVELKYKIKDESQREKIFWEMVEDLREEVLGEAESRRHPSAGLRASDEHEALNHESTKKPEKHEKLRKRTISRIKDKKPEDEIMDKKEESESQENVKE